MEEGKKFLWQCTIREIFKYLAIFLVSIIIVMYGMPRQIQTMESDLARAKVTLDMHDNRITTLETLAREQAYTNREIQVDLHKIDKNINIILQILQESGIRIMSP